MKKAFIAFLLVAGASSMLAIDFTHTGTTTGNWSTATDWTPNGVPNAVGDIVRYSSGASIVTTQDVAAGVTVGSIILEGSNNFSWTIMPTIAITLNSGSGTSLISNADTAVGTTNRLIFGSTGVRGILTLAEDLLISNTGAGTAAAGSGSILINSVIGGTGNLTISNVSNSVTAGPVILTGTNTFVGSITIAKGAATTNSSGAFGGIANQVNLGSSGGGSATLVTTAAGTTIANNIVAVAGSGGTLTLGSTSTSTNTSSTYSGTITLNGNVALTSAIGAAMGNTGSLVFSNNITGVGGITKVGAGQMTFSGTANSYQGGTSINLGTLIVTKDGGLGTGNVSLTASGVTLNLQGGATNNYINDNASISIVSGAFANLNYTGTDVVGGIVLNGVSQLALGTYGSPASGANFQSADFLGMGTLTLIPEPATYMLLGFGVLVCAQRFRRKKS